MKSHRKKKYVTKKVAEKLQKMKKRISHTQSTTNYCLISSTFQKKVAKNTSIVNLEKQLLHKKCFIFSTSEKKIRKKNLLNTLLIEPYRKKPR